MKEPICGQVWVNMGHALNRQIQFIIDIHVVAATKSSVQKESVTQ